MIPRQVIEIWQDDPGRLTGLPSRVEATGGYLDGNREYESGFMQASWQEAAEALEIEQDRLARASFASEREEFEDLLDGELEDWEAMATGGLDVGIAAAVLALNAAGCLTSSSCRGHYWQEGDAVRPWISVYSDPARRALIAQCAAQTGCGFAIDELGAALIFAPSIAEMIAFATALADRREEFVEFPVRRFRSTAAGGGAGSGSR
jgi:hypothetical protein